MSHILQSLPLKHSNREGYPSLEDGCCSFIPLLPLGLFMLLTSIPTYGQDVATKNEAEVLQMYRKTIDEAANAKQYTFDFEWIQPNNKKERCAIPISKEAKSTFVYWNGMCKDGFADGKGRIYFKGDTIFIDGVLNLVHINSKLYVYHYTFEHQKRLVDFVSGGKIFEAGKLTDMFHFKARFNFKQNSNLKAIAIAFHYDVAKKSSYTQGNNTFGYEKGYPLIELYNVAESRFQHKQITIDNFNRVNSNQVGPTIQRIWGPDGSRTISYHLVDNQRQPYSLPSKFINEYFNRFGMTQQYAKSAMSKAVTIAHDSVVYLENYCKSKMDIPSNVNSEQFKALCKIDSKLMTPSFDMEKITDLKSYPYLSSHQ